MAGDIQNKLKKLEEKKKQIDSQLVNIKQQLQQEERQKDTRRKILVGAFFLEKYKNKLPDLTKEIDSFLVRPQDRNLFGLSDSSKS
jgi:predicted  nucleic acid-binding Zn-ribbon protein